jgi:serine/threonine protein phosphatase 1
MYLTLDGQNGRHVWVVSDIHGCYQLLMQHLKRQKFNPYQDLLISVGDLIDRGPESLKCLQLINEKWFYAVRGNHEQMALDALESHAYALWLMNGGVWFAELKDEPKVQALALLEVCNRLPLIIDITCRNGMNVIAHADYPAAHYQRDRPVDRHRLLWDRSRITDLMAGKGEGISGADHFWFGHTPLEKRIDFANLHYIDTGAVFGGTLTLVQLQ